MNIKKCAVCSTKPMDELIDARGRVTVCKDCMQVVINLRRLYTEMLDSGLSEKEADQKICEMLEQESN